MGQSASCQTVANTDSLPSLVAYARQESPNLVTGALFALLLIIRYKPLWACIFYDHLTHPVPPLLKTEGTVSSLCILKAQRTGAFGCE